MKIRLRYFASLRDALDSDAESIELFHATPCVADALDLLRARGGIWAEALAPDQPLMAALDQEMVDFDAPLHEDAELAFFPPVTGG